MLIVKKLPSNIGFAADTPNGAASSFGRGGR